MKQKQMLILVFMLGIIMILAGCNKGSESDSVKEYIRSEVDDNVSDDISVINDLDNARQEADTKNKSDTKNEEVAQADPSKAEESKNKQGDSVVDDGGYLQVVHCEEWVSLRVSPDTKADRITTVPLGAVVYDLGERENGFCYVSFSGSNGYILEEYLVDFVDYYETGDDIIEGEKVNPPFGYFRQMSHEELEAHDDDGELYIIGEYTLQVAKKYTEYGEILKVGSFRDDEPVWGYVTGVPYVAELDATMAVLIEYGQEVKVMIINTDRTVCMVDLFTGELLWEKDNDDMGIGGTVCYDVAEDGIVYCAGYYDDGPLAIALDGTVLWRATPNDPDIYWPYDIDVMENGDIKVTYAGGDVEENTVVIFGKDGKRK